MVDPEKTYVLTTFASRRPFIIRTMRYQDLPSVENRSEVLRKLFDPEGLVR